MFRPSGPPVTEQPPFYRIGAKMAPSRYSFAKITDSDRVTTIMDAAKERTSSRVATPVRKTLEEAAVLSGATLNQFVVQAAPKEAHAVLERERFIHLSRRDAEVFFKALKNPPAPNARLKKRSRQASLQNE